MKKCLLQVLCAFTLFVSCEEIINEINIENRNIVLVAPSAGSNLTAGVNTFSWEPMEGARNYRIQIAKPNFNAPDQLVVDSLISTNSFSISLRANDYEWRVRGENGAYTSQYTSRMFNVN